MIRRAERHRAPWRLAAVLIALAPLLVARAETVALRYGEHPAQTVTIRGADARAAQPVVVLFGAPDPAFARVLAQRGYVLAEVAPPSGPDAQSAALRALELVAGRVAGHGGDPDRLHLVGDGDAAALVARLVAALSGARHRIGRDAIRSAILRGGRGFPLAIGEAAPPTLLMHARDDAEARRDAERYAARLREAGGSAETMVLSSGTPLDASKLLAWLDAAEVARVTRFEQLGFAYEPDPPAALTVIAADRRALLAGARDSPRLLRKAAPDAEWTVEHDFGARHEGIVALAASSTGPASNQSACVVLRTADGPLAVSCRHDGVATTDPHPRPLSRRERRGGTWSPARALPLEGSPRVSAMLEPAPRGAKPTVLVASGGRIARVVRGRDALLELDGSAPVLALGWAGGYAYAAIGGETPVLLRREASSGVWRTAAPVAAQALVAVPDPAGAGHEVLLAASADGVVRIDPAAGHAVRPEIAFAEAFRAALGDGAVPSAVGHAFAPLPHPQTHDLVHAIPVTLSHPDRGLLGAYYLVRQLDGSYAYAVARDFLAPRDRRALARVAALVASPFPGDAAVWFLGSDTAGRAALARGTLARGGPREAIWWDRTAPGHGLALHPVADGWLALLYTYEASREPAWYLAVGEIADGRFVPDSNGLARYRMPPDATMPVRDAERSGEIEIRFDAAADAPECRTPARDGAETLAVLELRIEGRRTVSCIEPIVYGPRGLPSIETTGVWQAASDRRFGLALAPQGYDGSTREAALVHYYDARGEPRWALGSAPVTAGAALVELSSFTGACLGCPAAPLASTPAGTVSHRMHGFCGNASGSATVTLAYPGEAGGQLVRRNAVLERLTRARCY